MSHASPTTAPKSQSGSRSRRLTALAATALLLLLPLALLGCGSDDDGGSESNGNAQDVMPPNIVTDSDLEATEEGTPERALLEWWQAFQFADAPTAVTLTSDETLKEVGEKDFAEVVEARGPGLQGIEVLEISEEGDSATLRVGMLTFQPEEPGEPPPDEPTTSNPNTFTMVDEGGEWLFDSPDFIAPMIESLKQAEKQAQEEEQGN